MPPAVEQQGIQAEKINMTGGDKMQGKMISSWIPGMLLAMLLLAPLPATAGDELAGRLDKILLQGLEEGHWQTTADDLYMWLKMKKKDFVVVDVRPNPASYAAGHIPGAVHIPYHTILAPANLAQLPKDKKIILVCDTGQVQNLPVIALRALGYDAYTMRLGYTAWIEGYSGGEMMKAFINRAAEKKYPLEK